MIYKSEKIKLINNKSSCYQMRYSLPGKNIYVKREDIIDFAFGGNKARFAEYIGYLVKQNNSKKIITFGSVHSNHVRVVACLCNYLNIECDIIILTEDEKQKSGNYSLVSYFGNVKYIYCKTSEAHDFIDTYLESQKNCDYLWIPGGGHMPECALAYVDVADEIIKHEKELGVKFDAIFLPCGTGTTTTGLLYGMKETYTDIVGITVARSVERCQLEVKDLFQEIDKDYDYSLIEKYIHILDSGIGYGVVTQEVMDIIKNVAVSDGFFLDPIYNAKSFLKMVNYLKTDNKYNNILYINTGGSPNLF